MTNLPMKKLIDFIPVLAMLFSIYWLITVYKSCVHRLKEIYAVSGKTLIMPTGGKRLNAWSMFDPIATDTPQILEEKSKIKEEAKRRLRYFFPILSLMFFGLAILSIILKTVMH